MIPTRANYDQPNALPRRPKRRQRERSGAELGAALQACTEKIEQLERDNVTHIKRMAAMQAEIDHLRALIGRNS